MRQKNWILGSVLRGKIIEKTEENYWIVSLGGKLFGVRNESERALKLTQWVDLEVISADPYQFRFIGSSRKNKKGINVRI